MKKMIFLFVLLCCTYGATVSAQEDSRFTASVTMDSILYGNKFKVTFTLENGQGNAFEAPIFPDFHVVSGPNTSSSFSMMNGTVSQSISYTYLLEPKDIGNYYIEPASIQVDGTTLETAPIEVMVVPNPDGIIQREERSNDMMSPFGNFEFRMDNMLPEEFFAPRTPAPKQEATPDGETPKTKKKKKKRKTYKL
ncbi:MAG: BatD family protein [Bacteroidota bacterium]